MLYNRLDDCCSGRLTNFRVSILDAAGKEVWKSGTLFPKGAPDTRTRGLEITPPEGTIGRQVKVELLGTGYLSLAEVEVYGRTANPKDNQACPRKAFLVADDQVEACSADVRTQLNTPVPTLQMVAPTPDDNNQWVRIRVIGLVQNAAGKDAMVLLRFSALSGGADLPVMANFVQAGQQTETQRVVRIGANPEPLNVTLTVPYGAFTSLPRGTTPHDLMVHATVRIDDVEVVQSSGFSINKR